MGVILKHCIYPNYVALLRLEYSSANIQQNDHNFIDEIQNLCEKVSKLLLYAKLSFSFSDARFSDVYSFNPIECGRSDLTPSRKWENIQKLLHGSFLNFWIYLEWIICTFNDFFSFLLGIFHFFLIVHFRVPTRFHALEEGADFKEGRLFTPPPRITENYKKNRRFSLKLYLKSKFSLKITKLHVWLVYKLKRWKQIYSSYDLIQMISKQCKKRLRCMWANSFNRQVKFGLALKMIVVVVTSKYLYRAIRGVLSGTHKLGGGGLTSPSNVGKMGFQRAVWDLQISTL